MKAVNRTGITTNALLDTVPMATAYAFLFELVRTITSEIIFMPYLASMPQGYNLSIDWMTATIRTIASIFVAGSVINMASLLANGLGNRPSLDLVCLNRGYWLTFRIQTVALFLLVLAVISTSVNTPTSTTPWEHRFKMTERVYVISSAFPLAAAIGISIWIIIQRKRLQIEQLTS